MRKVGIVNGTLRVRAKVVNAMSEFGQELLELFLHRIATVVRPYRDRSDLF
jgi:hypothetical protein